MKHTIEEITLKNGAKGLLVTAPGVDVVRTLVEFRAGFDMNPWDKYELPHVMEHTMFTNKSYPKPRQFSREVERNGAYNNASTSASSLEYDYEFANFETKRLADLISIQITQPTFPEGELATELGNVAEELNTNISNPGRSTGYNLYSAASGAPSLEARIEQLQSIKAEDLHSYYKDTHSSANMRFILAGDIDFGPLCSALDTDRLPTENNKRLDLPWVKSAKLEHPVVEIRDIPQIFYSFFTIHNNKYEYRELIAARILISLLSEGFSSTLFGEARERGLVYGLYMGASTDIYDTSLGIGGSVSPEHAEEYFKLAVEEVGKVLDGAIDIEQYEATKTLLKGKRARGYQQLSHLVNYYESYFTIGYQPFERYVEYLDTITLDESVEAFRKLFADDIWGFSFTGNIDEKRALKYQRMFESLFAR